MTSDSVPVACADTAANVNDTVLFERLFLTAFAVVTRIGTVFADKDYDAEANRELCRAFGAAAPPPIPSRQAATPPPPVEAYPPRSSAAGAPPR